MKFLAKNVRDLYDWVVSNLTQVFIGFVVLIVLADLIGVEVTWVTVALLALLALPTVLPRIRALELPGGVRIDLEAARHRADELGPATPPSQSEIDLEKILANNRELALAGLRIELERMLIGLARNSEPAIEIDRYRSLYNLGRGLLQAGVIEANEFALLKDISPVLNRAAHAEEIDPSTRDAVVDMGVSLLSRWASRLEKIRQEK